MPRILSCSLDDIPADGCKGLSAPGHPAREIPFFAVRQGQHLSVYRNRCPHLGVPLEWMPDQFLDRDGLYIQCATHGALFRRDNGLCVSGPCQGESLETIAYRIEGKSLIIDTAPSAE
jgi:nitrite reductase/ring-hydroxylating ferredoxin subunit